MNKIVTIQEVENISKSLKTNDQKLVLAGGCFDILHRGHLAYLRAARAQGEKLLVLLESDKSVRMRKGTDRPINEQSVRASLLASLDVVDYILPLSFFRGNKMYDELINRIKPAIIAVTKNSQASIHAHRQAQRIGAEVVAVIEQIPDQSTTLLTKLL